MANWDTIRGEILIDRQTFIVAALEGDPHSDQLIRVRRPRVRLCPFSYRRLENGIEMVEQDEPRLMTNTEIRRLERVLRQRQRQREATTQMERRAAEMEADLICNEEIFESEDESTEEERQQDRETADRRAREQAERLAAFPRREEEIRYTNRIYDAMIERQRHARRQ
jgi:hypothetical protein